ncbi:MAG TPA: hypothetical protein VFU43_04995 [Streptosporangiaceae bacterium]|nr:hypothetical protein [Streptosporangiaceae bacterium]
MIRLAWSRLRYRPVRGLAPASLAAALGALAAPSTLFVLACLLYLPTALVCGGFRPELRTLATLGRPARHLAGAVLAEYAVIGVIAAAVAAPLAAAGDTEAGAGPAAAVALAVALAAGAAGAVLAAQSVPGAERSRAA